MEPPKARQDLSTLRQKLKEKNIKYISSSVTLQVLGSGAPGAPKSLYMFSDHSRYLFNCGEGTQRLAIEHKMRLSKLEHVFITYPSWENLGGLPGLTLTLQDVGVPGVVLHGPDCLDTIFSGVRRFANLNEFSVTPAECNPEVDFEDLIMTVKYVQLHPDPNRKITKNKSDFVVSDKLKQLQELMQLEEDDETDYYAHEKPREQSSGCKDNRQEKLLSHPEMTKRSTSTEKNVAISMCYICHLKPRPGALNVAACKKKGVPPGPLFTKLKNGQDVTLVNGELVKSSDVTEKPDPGPVFIVVECPSEEYLPSLLKEPAFQDQQSSSKKVNIVIHFSPPPIINNHEYQKWMEKFPTARHLVINEDNFCLGSVAVHELQYKLNLINSDIFPLLDSCGMDIASVKNNKTTKVSNLFPAETVQAASEPDVSNDQEATDKLPLLQANTLDCVRLIPKVEVDVSKTLQIKPGEYVKEITKTADFIEELRKLKLHLAEIESAIKTKKDGDFPKIVFLGTGSCIPNKLRNTSGILIHTTKEDCILLDSGEGTYGQIVRFHGRDKSDEVLRNLKAIYISHLHTDHHVGLIGILKGRRRAIANLKSSGKEMNVQPVYLLAPIQLLSWLKIYDRNAEEILQDFIFVPNQQLYPKLREKTSINLKDLFEDLYMTDVSAVLVKHCPNAFGVSFTHSNSWKLTYSGDTMPCRNLIKLGQDSDILIHEATMEDELEAEALRKRHSTISQALQVGQEMNAKFVLLTHFSQRYAKAPRLSDQVAQNVGIAFDNMQVSMKELPLLPLMNPAFKLLFAEDYEELENRSRKRQEKQDKQDKKRAASSSPVRDAKVVLQ